MNAPARITEAQASGIIKLAILAVGGQGGGVLANWIADLAHRGGYAAQMTSVAGVAQRTGATIYYIEMAPRTERAPVFSLSPAAGDVDVLIAAELMEAGRAVTRGFVTPDRTVLIASTHRILAVSEKQIPGDGRGDDAGVLERVRAAAHRAECFDMEALAVGAGSFISASLFGGLAKSEALPFPVAQFEEVIGGSSKGAERSLAAFRAALEFEEGAAPEAPVAEKSADDPIGGAGLLAEWRGLMAQIDGFPTEARAMLRRGLEKVVDYQDLAYGGEYLGHVARIADHHGGDPALATTAAKYLANAMCYDDVIRVADLKTRAGRDARLRREQAAEGEIVKVTEYLHPRGEEIISLAPARLGAFITARPRLARLVDKAVNRGRRVRTDRIGGFATLWLLGGLRRWRRRLYRHRTEAAHLERLVAAAEGAPTPALAAEILACQRLIKGYSDTHARGRGRFDRVMEGAELVKGRDDAHDWVRRLREAALADEAGERLDGALATIRSF